MLKTVSFLLTILGLGAAGWIHRTWSEQLENSQDLQEAVNRVARIPMEIGSWKAEALPTDEISFAQAGAQGYWMRQYTHPRKRTTVLVILMAGRAGRMAVHTPEVCYQGAGFKLIDGPEPFFLDNEFNEPLGRFWTGKFHKGGQNPTDLRLYWAWNDGDGWQAPSDARWEFRGKPYLYKLYVSHDLVGPGQPKIGEDPAAEFMKELLPELSRELYVRTGKKK